MMKIKIKNENVSMALFTVLILLLFLLFPVRSWTLESRSNQSTDKNTAVLKTQESKQGTGYPMKKKKPVSQTLAGETAALGKTISGKTRGSETAKTGKRTTRQAVITENAVKYPSPETILYPILQYQIPEARRIVLDNGMILFILENHELPLVEITAVVRTGSAYDPPDKEGLAELACLSMRTGGTQALTGDALDDQLDRYAIRIGASADMEMARFNLSVLKENLERGVDLFSQILQSPRFDPPKVRTDKDLIRERLRRIEDDPQEYAFREFRKHLYRGNPRGNQKTMASVENLQASDLAGFHHKYFFPTNMMISVTGDITQDEAVRLLSRYFLPSTLSGKPEAPPPPSARGNGQVILVPKETPQSIVLAGFAAPAKNSPDYFAFSILDFVLGSGGFRSRIFQEIRNDQGLAYSAGSFYKAREDYGVFSAYGMTKADSTLKVLNSLKAIIEETANTPLTPDEISWAKKSMINGFLFSFVSADQIAYQQMMIEYDRLPQDFLQRWRENIRKVNSAEILLLARTYLSADRATIVVLGDEKRFDGPVK